jgi:hypothetical protein
MAVTLADPPVPKRATLADIAGILNAIAQLPNRRTTPQAGDLKGDFDEWFDGGAKRIITGCTTYEFADGTSAHVYVYRFLSISIDFPNGETVRIRQETSPSSTITQILD